MRKSDKQRIFKRFMEEEQIYYIAEDLYFKQKPSSFIIYPKHRAVFIKEVEQAIRDCVNEIKKGRDEKTM